MRTVLFLVQKEFLQIFRNRTMLPLLIFMPVVQTLLLSFAANYEIKNLSLGVIDHDLSPASRRLVNKFSSSGYFQVKYTGFSRAEADKELAADRVDLIIEIQSDFERALVREGHANIAINANAINASKAGIAMGYANGIVQDFRRELPGLGLAPSGTNPGGIQVSYSNWYNPELNYKYFMVPGILGEIVSLIICFLTALNIVREREMGTIDQLNVTPLRKWQFILGKLLPFWMLSQVMLALGLTVGYLVFHIPMEGSLLMVFGFSLLFAPCMLGLGFLISNFADTQQQAMLTAWFFLVVFILMCGLFTPVESMPLWAQRANWLNPVQYFVSFMRMVLMKGATFADVRGHFASVLAYGIVVNGLAVWTYRKRS